MISVGAIPGGEYNLDSVDFHKTSPREAQEQGEKYRLIHALQGI